MRGIRLSVQLVILGRRALLPAALLAVADAGADELSPFRASNLSPPIAILGLPLWAEVAERTVVGFTTELANHYQLSRREGDRLVLDGETLRLRAYAEVPVARRWSLGVDLPYLHQSGGVLDDLIDGWHSTFRLPDGARNQRPESVLQYDLADSVDRFFSLNSSEGGIGDVQISAARRLGDDWHIRAAIKLATGRESALAGSGSSDWSLSALRVVRGSLRGRAASYYFGAATLGIGQPTQVRFPTEDAAISGIVGGALSLGARYGIKGQIDVNSALYDSALEEIGATAVQATIGGWLKFGREALIEIAVSEDLHVSTAPDVVLYFNLNWHWQ